MNCKNKNCRHSLVMVFTIVVIAKVVSGIYVRINDGPSLTIDRTGPGHQHMHNANPTVHHFARYGLCSHWAGKGRLFQALARHFTHISDHTKIAFIQDICARRDDMLDIWVKEIFDRNNDGFISHFEKEVGSIGD